MRTRAAIAALFVSGPLLAQQAGVETRVRVGTPIGASVQDFMGSVAEVDGQWPLSWSSGAGFAIDVDVTMPVAEWFRVLFTGGYARVDAAAGSAAGSVALSASERLHFSSGGLGLALSRDKFSRLRPILQLWAGGALARTQVLGAELDFLGRGSSPVGYAFQARRSFAAAAGAVGGIQLQLLEHFSVDATISWRGTIGASPGASLTVISAGISRNW